MTAGLEIVPSAALPTLAAEHGARFAKTYCSQCGGEFGPGEHGFSHCQDHRHLMGMAPVEDERLAQLKGITALLQKIDGRLKTIEADLLTLVLRVTGRETV